MLSNIFSGCGQTKQFKNNKYQVGQIWEYETRDSEDASTLTIVALQNHDELGGIINVFIDSVKIKNPSAENGISTIQHLPFSKEAIDKSVTKLKGKTDQLPDYKEGYNEWKKAFDARDAGVFTITVKEAVEGMEITLNQGQEIKEAEYKRTAKLKDERIRAELVKMMEKDGPFTFVIFEESNTGKFVQFAGNKNQELTFDFPSNQLSKEEFQKANEILKKYSIEHKIEPTYTDETETEVAGSISSFTKRINNDIDLAIELISRVMIDVFGFNENIELNIETD